MNLENIQKKIDSIDFEILKKLNERMELTLQTKKIIPKSPDKKRENNIREKLDKFCKSHSLIRKNFARQIYQEIRKESSELLEKPQRLIGFQGEHGAYSEVAARNYGSNLVPIPCHQFADVFKAVDQGNLEFGIVPVQNSLGGAVSQVNELLIHTKLKVVGAIG